MKKYGVKQLSDLAKISVRTSHYYDEIGLLKPKYIAQNNYRFYGEDEALRLQQILIYRDIGIELKQIKQILDSPDFDLKAALNQHKTRISENIERQKMLLAVIIETLANLKGDEKMEQSKLYEWHSESKQADYVEWLNEKYGAKYNSEIVHSQKAFTKMGEHQRAEIIKQIEEIEADLVTALKAGINPCDAQLNPILEAHREWVSHMWARSCPKLAYGGLADTYLSHPDFVKRYETLATGFSEFLASAMRHYAKT